MPEWKPTIPLPGKDTPLVYIFRDAEGAPLYIGRTDNLHLRVRAHRDTAWFAEVAALDWEVCASRAESVQREREYIARHTPPYNVKVHPKQPKPRPPAKLRPVPLGAPNDRLSVSDVAALCGISRPAVLTAIKQGRLVAEKVSTPFQRGGWVWEVRRAEAERFRDLDTKQRRKG